jgi:hypothetical protein
VTAGNLFAGHHVGAGANVKRFEGFQVAASIAADSTLELDFVMPPAIPTGTPTFRILCMANATSGAARINPKWVSVAAGVSPSGATPVAETVTPTSVAGAAGVGDTVTWGASDNDQLIDIRWTMNATTVPAANELVVVNLVFETASYTLAQVLTFKPMIGWV